MEKNQSYITSTIILFFIFTIIFIYFIPLTFFKFISWLGNNESKLTSTRINNCIVLAKNVD